ncbi:MAG TPA: hypothetical protein VFC05_02975 [Nitrososphaeraceae archaeon]|nr:hypothetical protein [Nitrososphaeraceae archaeon]
MHLVITGGKILLLIYLDYITIPVNLEKKIGGHQIQKVIITLCSGCHKLHRGQIQLHMNLLNKDMFLS